MATMSEQERSERFEAQRERIREQYLRPVDERPASSHFFFDIGNNNLLAFFDFPGLDQGPYQEVLGGLHHLAISVEPSRWERLRDKLTAAGVDFAEHSDVSLYFRDPDGARIELIADPLGEMYGSKVL